MRSRVRVVHARRKEKRQKGESWQAALVLTQALVFSFTPALSRSFWRHVHLHAPKKTISVSQIIWHLRSLWQRFVKKSQNKNSVLSLKEWESYLEAGGRWPLNLMRDTWGARFFLHLSWRAGFLLFLHLVSLTVDIAHARKKSLKF